jgi:AraC-like DNA-binding protein/uncharacterized protein YbcI
MVVDQAEQKFYQQKSIELSETVAGIKQRIKTLKLELSVEKEEPKYGSYTFSDEYNSDLKAISKRLSTMVKKFWLLHSSYFYDRTTGSIYSSMSGRYAFDSFYDTQWIEDANESYRVQQLPLRYAFNNSSISENTPLYSEYNHLVLSLVVRERPDFFLVANISVNRLYADVLNTYDLGKDNDEFFFITQEGKLLEGRCDYIDPNELLDAPAKLIENDISFVKQKDRIYFLTDLDFGMYCVTSYPIKESYQEAQYLGKYVLFVCLAVLFFLLIMSAYMAKKLYHPINALYSDIADNAANLQEENTHDEIDMLKHVFAEMNAFNSNAKQNLKQFDEISKIFRFRNFLEHYQCKADFLSDHPYLFDSNEYSQCELLLIKFDITHMNFTKEEEMVFRLNLQEVLLTYLQSSMKGILTKTENDVLVLLYHGNERESISQTRTVLSDTVIKLSENSAYFAVSQPIVSVEDILSQYSSCLELVDASYFFSWKNELITSDRIAEAQENDDLNHMLLRVNTSLIRSIVSQKEHEIEAIFQILEHDLRQIHNAVQARDICNQIVIELDHEFHFNKALSINFLQSLNENKILTDLLSYMCRLLTQLSRQFGKNDARENNYCELAKKYLDENYMRDMNIIDVADQLDISYSYLSKIFRIKTGVTLTDYLNKVRIENSKEYLEKTFLTLNEIAEKVGYNNVQSYQRFFKKYMNITPGDYRRLHNL